MKDLTILLQMPMHKYLFIGKLMKMEDNLHHVQTCCEYKVLLGLLSDLFFSSVYFANDNGISVIVVTISVSPVFIFFIK